MRRFCALFLALLIIGLTVVPSVSASDAAHHPALTASSRLHFDLFSFLQWDMRLIRMSSSVRSGPTGAGVRVGIIDSGLSGKNRDLDPNHIQWGRDFVDPQGSLTDTDGHGTFIAGIIGAQRSNGYGIAGMAPDATLIPMKVSANKKSEVHRTADAIRACVDDYNCDVINLSFGSEAPSEFLYDAIRYASDQGVIIVCSVGNSGTDALSYPAAYEETIGVGSVDNKKDISSFSNHNDSVFVVAPGEEVVSLGRSRYGITFKNGTSYAAPFVSGLAVLLKERYPQMTRWDFCEILKVSCLDLGEEGYDPYYGWGLIQVDAAFGAAAEHFGS